MEVGGFYAACSGQRQVLCALKPCIGGGEGCAGFGVEMEEEGGGGGGRITKG